MTRIGLRIAVLFAAGAFAGSCTKNAPESAPAAPGDGSIGFAVTVRNGWDGPGPVQGASMRTAGILPQEDHGFTTELQGGDRPFCLDVSTTGRIGTAPQAVTRGMQTETDDFPASFRMWAYSYTDTDAASFDVMSGEEIALRENGRWEPSKQYYWRWYTGQKLGFIACVPDPADNLTPPSDPTGSFVYETDPDLQKQQDLLIASIAGVTGTDYEKTGVPLVFRHVLTAIKFRINTTATGMELRNIRSLSLKNVRYKGSFRVNAAGAGSGTPAVVWTLDPAVRSYTDALAPETGDLPEDKENPGYAEPGYELTDAEGVFMLPPQTLPAGAQIVIEYTLPGEEELQTMTADIGGTEWPMGKTVVYNLSSSKITTEDILDVPTDDIVLTHRGGTAVYAIRSYRKAERIKAGQTEELPPTPLAWSAEFSTDGGKTWTSRCPEWVTGFTDQAEGSVEETKYEAAVSSKPIDETTDPNTSLRAAAAVTDYDLSTAGGTTPVNTANCYVVNAPGTYRFPLIYGNAIRSGADNKEAYAKQTGEWGMKLPFWDCVSRDIQSPFITSDRTFRAAILWQDENDLVTNVQISPTQEKILGENVPYITFEVNPETVRQGNCVIALYAEANNNSTLTWSWHIWVTGQRLDDYVPVETANGTRYDFLPVSIGWYSNELIDIYQARDVQVRITQTGHDPQTDGKTFTIRQQAYETASPGSQPYFQFGRKAPMPALNADNSDKATYPANIYRIENGGTKLSVAIQNPNVFYSDSYGWFGGASYWHLWNAAATGFETSVRDYRVVKTVYDPSPVGYTVPASGAFASFDAANTANGPSETSGFRNFRFYCSASQHDNDRTILFRVAGQRSGNGRGEGMGRETRYWTAVPATATSAQVFHLTDKAEMQTTDLSGALPVRPVREK